MRVWILAGLLCATIALAPAAEADVVTFDFTGEVFFGFAGLPSGIWAGQGSVVTGSFSYDTDLADFDASARTDDFRSNDPVGNQALGGWAITVTVGAVTRTTADNANVASFLHHRISIVDSPGVDLFRYQASRVFGSDDGATLDLVDFTPIPDGVATGSDNLTGSLPTTPFDPALFSDNVGRSIYQSHAADGTAEGRVFFTITSITSAGAPIPEPGSLALVGVALAGLVWSRRPRKT